MQVLLQIRLKQVARIIQSIGWGYVLLLLFVASGVSLQLINNLLTTDSFLPVGLMVFFIWMIHLQRPDRQFLELLDISLPPLFLAEYCLVCIPIFLLFGIAQQWMFIAVIFLGILPIIFVKAGLLSGQVWTMKLPLSWLPSIAVEYKSGIRRYFFIFLIPYALGLIFAYASPAVPLIPIVVISFLVCTLFDPVEDKDMIAALQMKGHIVSQKIKAYILLQFTFFLPLISVFLFFHSSYWYLLLAVVAFSLASLIFSIVYKYARYRPNRKRVMNSTAIGLFTLGFFNPLFFPGSVIAIIYFWRKAYQNINYYYAEHS